MIDIENSLLRKFGVTDVYRENYIKIYPIYNEHFEFFRETVLKLKRKLHSNFETDTNLRVFIIFYQRFIKISSSLPITLAECTNLTEKNSDINLKKLIKNIKVAYPDYIKEFDFIFNKFNEFKKDKTNLFLDNNLNPVYDKENLILYDSRYKPNTNFQYVKSKSYFINPNFKKVKSISLLNPTSYLLQEIAFLDICESLKVLNFSWFNRDYSNIDLFISNRNIQFKKLSINYIDTPKPKINLLNEFKGEISDDDLELSSDLEEIFKLLQSKNNEDLKIEDKDQRNDTDLEKIRATLFQLSNGKIVLLKNEKDNTNDKCDVIERTPLIEKILIKSKKVDLIKPGEFVLLEGERTRSTMLEKEAANDIENNSELYCSKNASDLYADRKDWKFRLKQEINRLGLEKVISKLKEYGGRKNIKISNIKYWLNPKSLRTDDPETFFAIMKLCGLHNKSNEIWINMETLEKAHLKAGRVIKKKIEQEITKDPQMLYEKGYQEYFLDEKGSGSIEVYKIIEKGKSVMVKLSITDKALLPSDLH